MKQAGKINIWILKATRNGLRQQLQSDMRKCALFLILFYKLSWYVEH